MKKSAAVSPNIKVLYFSYFLKHPTRYQKKTKGHCYCKTNQGVFSHLLPGWGSLLFVMIILNASLISFPVFLGRSPYRCKTHRTHKRKTCFLKCNHIFLKKLSAIFKLNTGRPYNKFMKGNQISLIGPKQLYPSLVLIFYSRYLWI